MAAPQTGVTAMFRGLEAVPVPAAEGKSKGGTTGKAGSKGGWGSAWFLLVPIIKPWEGGDTAQFLMHNHKHKLHSSV